jgi:hypothetical protein
VLECPLRAPHVVVEDLDDDICLYRPDIDEVVVLNHSAGDVWRLADGTTSVPDIVTRLAQAYAANTADIRTDVHRVVDDLEARGYLVDAAARSGRS